MNDARHMQEALSLTSHALGRVSPRPPVGAVIVDTSGTVVGRGFSQPDGGPHAESVALAEAGTRATGSTLYVTLEPCSHTGAQPPCADAVIQAGIVRVVIAMADPNPKVDGQGIAMLQAGGLTVEVGPEQATAARLYEPFTRWITTGLPLVTLKLAGSLDGKTAALDGSSQWITGEQARHEVHELRSEVEAVMVGSRTVAIDNPSLCFRLSDSRARQPARVVLDSKGTVAVSAQVFDGATRLIIVTTSRAPTEILERWESAGAEVVIVDAAEAGVDLNQALNELGGREITHVLCEGGQTLASSLIDHGLVDRFRLYCSGLLIGGNAPGLLSVGAKTLSDAVSLDIESVTRVGADIRIDARPSKVGR